MGEFTPPLGANVENIDTKLSSSKELVISKASLSGTERLNEIDSSNLDKELVPWMNPNIFPSNLRLVTMDPSSAK
jgi:hypothetical protein